MLMAKKPFITFIPQFDGGRETMQKWGDQVSASQTEWFHIASILLHGLAEEAQQEIVRAYATAQREHSRDLVYAKNAVMRAFLMHYQAKAASSPPSSVLADAADAVLSRKTRNGKAAG
jgi:hypothetical protein